MLKPNHTALALLLAAMAAFPAHARADSGPLEPLGCVAEEASAFEDCGVAKGIDNGAYLTITPDGRNVYVPGRESDTIAVFKRDRTDGALTQLQGQAGCVSDSDNPTEGCSVADGLDRAAGVTTSPDGRSVYVTGVFSNALVSFSRDPKTGVLTPLGCFTDALGPDDDCTPVAGLDAPIGVAVSPDGKFVYVTASESDAVTWFSRDAASGALTFAGCVAVRELEGCATVAPGLDSATYLAMSADGASLYVVSPYANSIAAFSRNATTGSLTSLGCISGDDGIGQEAGCAPGHEVDFPQFVAVSPDGGHVYVSATDLHALIVLTRDPATGAVTQTGCISDLDNAPGECDQPAVGLSLPLGIAITPDSRQVYTGAFGYGSISSFERDVTTGLLRQFGPCFAPDDPRCEEVAHLGRAGFVALSPDQRHLYANGPSADSVTYFARSTSSTGPKVKTREAPVKRGGVAIKLGCPANADGGCIGNVKLTSRSLDLEVGFKKPLYDLLAGQTKKVVVKLKKGEEKKLKGVKSFKALAIAVGREPGDLLLSGSAEITIKP